MTGEVAGLDMQSVSSVFGIVSFETVFGGGNGTVRPPDASDY
jgi:hypothetical protein